MHRKKRITRITKVMLNMDARKNQNNRSKKNIGALTHQKYKIEIIMHHIGVL